MDSKPQSESLVAKRTEFTRAEIRQFAHGQLTNKLMVEQMAAQLDINPDGDIARYLKEIEFRGRRILDPNDALYFVQDDAS